MVSPTTITEVENHEKGFNVQKLNDLSPDATNGSRSSGDCPAPIVTMQSSQVINRRPKALPMPSTLSTNITPVTPLHPYDSDLSAISSTSNSVKATPSELQQYVQFPPPYRFQTPSYVFNTEQSNNLEQLKGSAGCNCKKSRCLKLYCQCFAASTTCGSKCRCDECYNTTENGPEIDTARRSILSRNPIAFHKAKVLVYQQQHDERQYQLHHQWNPNSATFPHQPPSMMNGPYYGTHRASSNHMPQPYFPGAPFHRHPHTFRQPTSTHTGPTYHAGNSAPSQQQHLANPFYRTSRYADRQHTGRMKSTTENNRPSVVEVSPNNHANMNRGTPPPMPPRMQLLQEGCNCRRTNCLKKYCECYQQSIFCCGNCKCVDCKNYPGGSLRHNANQNGSHPVSTIKHNDPPDPIHSMKPSDHCNIKLNYRPEQLSTIRPPCIRTQETGTQETLRPTQMATKTSLICHPNKYPEPNTSKGLLVLSSTTFPSSPAPLASTEKHVSIEEEEEEEEEVITVTTNAKSAEEDSPRSVVQETVKSRHVITAAADDAMIQAAMAMTELLNGIASSPSAHSNEQKFMTVSTNASNGTPNRVAETERHDSEKVLYDDPSLPSEFFRPSKKYKGSEQGTVERNNKVVMTKRSIAPLPDNRTQTQISSHQHQYQHPTTTSCNAVQPSPPSQMLHHQRCLPMSSRSHLITTTTSSSSSSSSSSTESDDFQTFNKHGRQKSANSYVRKADKVRCNPFESITLKSGLPKSLSFRKICSRCGRTRSEHGEMGFGNSCSFENCGRCGASVRCHQRTGQVMGVLCQLSVSSGATQGASATYQRRLQDLAAHADLERQNIHRHRHGRISDGISE